MILDYSIVALISAGLVFIAYVINKVLEHDRKMTSIQGATQKQSKSTPILEGITMALDEMNKIGEEQIKICQSMGMNEAQYKAIINPVKQRYDKLKWVKDHEGIAVPLIEVGKNVIDKFINNLI